MSIKLLILDIDGVMTDGTKIYDVNGNVFAKTYCDRDFTAIKRFKASGVKVCFLSGDKKVNEEMARNRNIDFYCSRTPDGMIDKSNFISQFQKIYNSQIEEMAYVGDDIFDIPIMEKLNYAYCPLDAPDDVKNISTWIIDRKSGDSVIARLYDYLIGGNEVSNCNLSQVVDIDRLEVF